jgi:hypothetical protein
MVNCLHPLDLVYDHYRTGFQNKNLASVDAPDAFNKMTQPHARRTYKNPIASFLWLRWVTIETIGQFFRKLEKYRKTLSSTFLFFS